MGLFDPITPPELLRPWLPSTQGLVKVKIAPDLNNKRLFHITWPAQIGATRYIVYVTPNPMNLNKFTDVPNTQTQVDFEVPILLPDDVIFYAWVSYINPQAQEAFISSEPVWTMIDSAFETNPLSFGTERDIITGGDMKFYAEEIRRRGLAMLENDGEDFFLYIRRMFGQPCVCLTEEAGGSGRTVPMSTPFYEELKTQFDPAIPPETENVEAKDPEYQATYRCPECFGTGISGGYYPRIKIRIRYGNLPKRIIQLEEQGIEFSHNFNSWTLWHPRVKERDFLVRARSGERFLITEPAQTEWRGIPLHQEFNAVIAPRSAMIYSVTDQKIIDGLDAESSFDVARWDWSVWR